MRVACILVGGPNYWLDGWLMELHPYCGPSPVNPKTLEPHDQQRIPKKFFDAFYRWDAGGRKFYDQMRGRYPVCRIPNWCDECSGTGDNYKHIVGKHYMYAGTCPKCEGKKFLWSLPELVEGGNMTEVSTANVQ